MEKHTLALLCSQAKMRQEAIIESSRALGIDQLKPEQMKAMDSILQGNDTFVSLPTGYGKLIIFAALPKAFDKFKGRHTCFF